MLDPVIAARAKFLIKFVCGHVRKTSFLYGLHEPKWLDAFCLECQQIKDVTAMAPALNSKEVEL